MLFLKFIDPKTFLEPNLSMTFLTKIYRFLAIPHPLLNDTTKWVIFCDKISNNCRIFASTTICCNMTLSTLMLWKSLSARLLLCTYGLLFHICLPHALVFYCTDDSPFHFLLSKFLKYVNTFLNGWCNARHPWVSIFCRCYVRDIKVQYAEKSQYILQQKIQGLKRHPLQINIH